MSVVNDISLNLFYGSKPNPAGTLPPASNPSSSQPPRNVKKRPRSYPTPVPHFPSTDEQAAISPPTTGAPLKKGSGYLKPAPLYDLPKLKPREHSTLGTDSLLPSPSALSNPSLFTPSSSFSSFNLSPRLLSALSKLSPPVTHPTRIQSLAIPRLLSSPPRDCLIRSHTGSGKTLAYLLPLVHSLSLLSLTSPITRSTPPLALILSPTRELTLQIFHTLTQLLTAFHWIIPTHLMGGEQKQREKARLRKGCHIIIATPGRLLDHLETTSKLDVSCIQWLVMDEADRLLDLGFEREVGEILKKLQAVNKGSKRTQNVLVSATIDNSVRKLADLTLQDPLQIGFDKAETEEVGGEEKVSMPPSITHHVLQVESRHRLVALAAFLRHETMLAERRGEKCKMIVFFSTCHSVNFHHALFSSLFWPPPTSLPSSDEASPLLTSPLYQLHGQMEQKERTATFQTFSSSSSSILLCTDVAARGLDLPAVDWIIQFDVAETVDDYVHRVGRCGRIGREGKAVVFLTEKEMPYLKLLPPSLSFTPLTLAPILSSLRHPSIPSSSPPAGALLQRLCESLLTGQKPLYSLAVSAYQSWVRAYAGYPRIIKKTMGGVAGLHLGHVCRSFALGEEPTKVGRMREGEVGRRRKGKEEEEEESSQERAKGMNRKERLKEGVKEQKQEKRADGIVETVKLFKKRRVDTLSEFAA